MIFIVFSLQIMGQLTRHIFDHGWEMQIQSIPYFALTITFQKKESKNEESIDRRGSEDAS